MFGALGTLFVASLLGSAHCAGMCGGFVAFGAASGASAPSYHLGRLITYLLLGALAGAAGAGVDWAGSWAGVPRLAAVLAGAAMIVWGAMALGRSFGLRIAAGPTGSPFKRLLFRIHRDLGRTPPLLRGAILGLSTTLLPCGWLYAFAVTAAGTGSALWGAATMGVFWLGTVPILVALGFGVQRAAGPLRAHLPRIGAVAVMAIGLVTLAGRLEAPPAHAEAPQAASHCHGH
jgi:hypothetical protein